MAQSQPTDQTTEQRRTDLKRLQKLDLRIQEAKKRIGDFDPLFEQVEEPALILESDLGTTRSRLQEMKLEERRLELSSEEKRTRQKKLEDRLGSVRNLREEAAVSAELEMVKRSIQTDEQEALALLDQIRKMEERAAELEAAYAEASELVEPKMNELVEQRAEAERQLSELRSERERFTAEMDGEELKIYDAIRAGGRTVAVAELTEDGACGHCFGMVPLQRQNEIRHGTALIRCEGCGVILTAPEPEGAELTAEETPELVEVPEQVEEGTEEEAEVDEDAAAEERVAELLSAREGGPSTESDEAEPSADEDRDKE